MNFLGKLKLIDLYKKVPHDLTEGTYGGAICIFLVFYQKKYQFLAQ